GSPRYKFFICDVTQGSIMAGSFDCKAVVFYSDKGASQVRQLNAEKADAAVQVQQMSRTAGFKLRAHHFDHLWQQEKIILEEGVRRHFPVLRWYSKHNL